MSSEQVTNKALWKFSQRTDSIGFLAFELVSCHCLRYLQSFVALGQCTNAPDPSAGRSLEGKGVVHFRCVVIRTRSLQHQVLR